MNQEISPVADAMQSLTMNARAAYATCLALTFETGEEFVSVAEVQYALGLTDDDMGDVLRELSDKSVGWTRFDTVAAKHAELLLCFSIGVSSRPSAKDWQKLKARAFRDHGAWCIYCGDEAQPLTLDHVRPISRGGSNHPANLVPACSSCNKSKGAKSVEEFLESRQ